MSTVPKADAPPPENNAQTKLVSDAMSGNYGRPASGGPPIAGKSEGNPGSQAPPAADIPGYAINWAGNAPSTGGYQVGPDMGSGSAVVIPSSGDRPSGGKEGAEIGTVGNSGNQGAGPGPTPMK